MRSRHAKNRLPMLDAAFLQELSRAADSAGVFGHCFAEAGVLHCEAKHPAEPAWYRVFLDKDEKTGTPGVYVALQTAFRWLSQSIEADLMHTGDKLEELLFEELQEIDYAGPALRVEHFRDEAKLYTFRSRVPVEVEKLSLPESRAITRQVLLAYEACFRVLGDMAAGEGE